jgi:hypothetical protein
MQALLPVKREASTTDYPFPCLRNPEDELPANGTEQTTDEEEDDDVFGEGFDDEEIQKGLDQMRLSSAAKMKAPALSADGHVLVSIVLLFSNHGTLLALLYNLHLCNFTEIR